MAPRRRKVQKKVIQNDSTDEDDEPVKIVPKKKQKTKLNSDSSSESDIEKYLQPPDEIDLDATFFRLENDKNKAKPSIPAAVSEDETEPQPSTSNFDFGKLLQFKEHLEEAKRCVEMYDANTEPIVHDDDVKELLMTGEGPEENDDNASIHSSQFETMESEGEDWEEVKTAQPKDLEITVQLPGTVAKQKKKEVDLMESIKRRLARIQRENQIYLHRVHLLCWIAHGNYLNRLLNTPEILATALSLLPSEQCYPPKRADLNYLEQIVKWYTKTIKIPDKPQKDDNTIEQAILDCITNKEARDKEMLVYIFIVILRSLGLQCRLVISFRVLPIRPPTNEFSLKTVKSDNKKGSKGKKEQATKKIVDKNTTKTSVPVEKHKMDSSKDMKECKVNLSRLKTDKPVNKTDSIKTKAKPKKIEKPLEKKADKIESSNKRPRRECTVPKTIDNTKQKPKEIKKNPSKAKKRSSKKLDESTEDFKGFADKEIKDLNKNVPSKKLRSTKKSVPQLDGLNDSSSDEFEKKKQKKPNLKKVSELSGRQLRSGFKKNEKSPIQKKKKVTLNVVDDIVKLVSDAPKPVVKKVHDDSDDDFVPKVKVKRRIPVKSSPEDKKLKVPKNRCDVWCEVFLENEEQWITVDVVRAKVHCVEQLHAGATPPVSYIVAWNNDNSLKDVTSRYCKHFNTVTRKLRTDSSWWQESVRPFMRKRTVRDKEEDEELERQQLDKPLPSSIAEYKNHPLYALKRHILKFEALYPPEPPILGYVKGEAVYPRRCVYILHSRDMWLKQAKVVRLGEQPYKIVKARPKYDRLSNSIITDQLLDIFGPWQVEDYIPPTAENGVVPRSAYGSVELFKPSMLPKKTVHIRLPGLNRLARKMNIDCAPAVIGFEFTSGRNLPTYDGWVVCEEYEDTLIAAWEIEQEEIKKREREKFEKRVYGNWRKLIRGLLIRERLKARYNFGEPSTTPNDDE